MTFGGVSFVVPVAVGTLVELGLPNRGCVPATLLAALMGGRSSGGGGGLSHGPQRATAGVSVCLWHRRRILWDCGDVWGPCVALCRPVPVPLYRPPRRCADRPAPLRPRDGCRPPEVRRRQRGVRHCPVLLRQAAAHLQPLGGPGMRACDGARAAAVCFCGEDHR